ncbi:hypothetical protein OR62_07860 [Clostridium tetani]|uniref:hypothetical protein n=1 Tax=Clostridium tetani TaxID=1513 RepID=UPI000575C6FA|nr:hypothetical protein [Clostridium tetani]KHO39097.1 hypothetical protein OR62_07860 [Clostridium tetani]
MEIYFGALEPSLKEQLDKQNMIDTKVEKHEKIRISIHMLNFHSYITMNQKEKMFKKLFKDIKSNITKKESDK